MMETCIDTGMCAQEDIATLLIQQKQLVEGRRHVQMFPAGTIELLIPKGLSRYQNIRGVFHYRPEAITVEKIKELSRKGRENEFLNLGPYSKHDIALRALGGEEVVCITEYTPDRVEVRSAAGTTKTSNEQRDYFERTKEPGNVIVIGEPPSRVLINPMKG